MTATQLHDLIVKTLVRRSGGNPRHWRLALGAIHIHDRATHPHCNWSVRPTGSVGQVAEIERLLDSLRLDHPIVTAP